MALQIWLPLNGNLENKGLLDFNPTINTTPTYLNQGKIGEKGMSAGAITMPADITAQIFNNYEFSFACWIYINNTTSRAQVLGNSNSGSDYSIRRFSIFQYPSANDLQVDWRNENDASTPTISKTWKGILPTNTWTHIAITYQNPVVKIYQNGILYGTVSGVLNVSDYAANTKLFSNCGNNSRILNDYRLYNHCLSAREVEEISKCLILHYPLNNSNENLLNDIIDLTKWTKESSVTVTWDDTIQMYKIKDNSHSSNRWGIYYDINLTANTTYTFSILGKKITQTAGFGFSKGSTFPANAISFDTIKERKSYTLTTDSTTSSYRIYINQSSQSGGTNDAYFALPKLEINSDDTGFKNIDDNIIYDTSGYCNNGIITGNIKMNIDTPRYNNAIQFLDSNCAIQINDLSTLIPCDEFTFNIWFKKKTNEWSTKSYETILGGPSGFELEGKSANTNAPVIYLYSWGQGTINYTLDEWHMLTMVRTTSNTKFYLDGQYIITGTAGTIPSGDYFLGAWRTASQQNYRGLLSDVRIYNNILSDEQILELYNTSMTIDDNNNIYTREIIEQYE